MPDQVNSNLFNKFDSYSKPPSGLREGGTSPVVKPSVSKPDTQSAQNLAMGQGLFGRSSPKISTSPNEGTTITGGDSHSLSHSTSSPSWVSPSTTNGNEALDSSGVKDSAIRVDRQSGTPLTISDDSSSHPNSHFANSTKDSPLTINSGNSDGDKYRVSASEGSTTTLNGSGESSPGATRDVVDYSPHLSSPNSTTQLDLNNFNPSRTDLQVDGKSLFADHDANYSGSINFSRGGDDGRQTQMEMNLKPSSEE